MSGERESQPRADIQTPAEVVRFAYRGPNLWREQVISGEAYRKGDSRFFDGRTLLGFSAFMWTVTESKPDPESSLLHTPGAADLSAIAALYRQFALAQDSDARRAGLSIVEFRELIDEPNFYDEHDRVRFWVDNNSGRIERYASIRFGSERQYHFEHWMPINGATVAQRVRRTSLGGSDGQFIYRNLQVNAALSEQDLRVEIPKDAARIPLIRPWDSLLATRRYLEQHPDDAGGHAHYASLLLTNSRPGEGRRERGVAELRKAIELAPDAGHYRSEYARYLTGDEAIHQLEKAVELSPNAARFWTELASRYMSRNDLEKAEAAFRRAVTLAEVEQAKHFLFQLHLKRNQWDLALKAASAEWHSARRIWRLLSVLDRMISVEDRAQIALAEYERLRKNPDLSDQDFSQVLRNMLKLSQFQGANNPARQRILTEAIRERPALMAGTVLPSMSGDELKEFLPERIKQFEQASAERTKQPRLKLWLVRAYREAGMLDRALALLEEVSRDIRDRQTLDACVYEWRNLQQEDRAATIQIEFVKQHPKDAQSKGEIFSALYSGGRYQQALEVYGDPLQKIRWPPFYHYNPPIEDPVLICYRSLQKSQELIERLRDKLAKEPESFVLRLAIGDVARSIDDRELALKTWRQLAERTNLGRIERLALAYRFERAEAIEDATAELIKAASMPVTKKETHAVRGNAVLPLEYFQFRAESRVLDRLAQLQERLGNAEAARTTRARKDKIRQELDVADFSP